MDPRLMEIQIHESSILGDSQRFTGFVRIPAACGPAHRILIASSPRVATPPLLNAAARLSHESHPVPLRQRGPHRLTQT